jgi:anti-sigma B factor antagonist
MVLFPDTLGRAGPLLSDILELHLTGHGSNARVVTVTGEVNALTAPELAALLTAQLIVAPLVVVDLNGVRFLDAAGLSALVEANEFATREDRELRLVCNSQTATWALDASGIRERFTFADTVLDALNNACGTVRGSTRA